VAHRHLTTGITLLVLVGILVVGAVLGSKSLFAPLPDSGQAAGSPSPTCTTQTVKKGQRIRSTQVQVSVFNGGTRSGLADETLKSLVKRGFTAGDTGNAPSDTKVRRVRVFTTTSNDLSATLVARQFGRSTKVVVTDTDLGPGVDVVVGNKFDKLAKARHVIAVRKSSSVCVPVPEPSASPAG
jgi:hypothetical protein